MIERKTNHRPTIDLDGPEGNAFILMGYAKRYADQMGENSDKILNEMQKSDYLHLLKTFEKHFGTMVILKTNNPNYLNL